LGGLGVAVEEGDWRRNLRGLTLERQDSIPSISSKMGISGEGESETVERKICVGGEVREKKVFRGEGSCEPLGKPYSLRISEL